MPIYRFSPQHVADVDFDYQQIIVRDAKGNKDRVVPLPQRLVDPLRGHLVDVKALFEEDLKQGCAGVYLPNALARKYPNAPRDWVWQYVFPSARLSADPRTGQVRRHHVHESGLQKALKKAAREAGIDKRISTHTLRHSFSSASSTSIPKYRTLRSSLGVRVARRADSGSGEVERASEQMVLLRFRRRHPGFLGPA
jgi:integrase